MSAASTRRIRTICPYGAGLCPCQDGVIVTVENGKVTGMAGDGAHPVSNGYTCAKALRSWEVIYHPDRIKQPMLKTASGWKGISWEDALDTAAERLGEVKQKYGSLAFAAANVLPGMGSGPDYLFTCAMGSPNAMHNLDLCQGPAMLSDWVTAGSPMLTNYHAPQDFANAKGILLVGTDLANSTSGGGHWQDILRARKNGAKLIVVDPRRCESAKHADVWLQIRPGTDGALGLGLLHIIINEELYDKDFVANFTVGFDQLHEHVQQYTPEWVAGITSLSIEQIVETARLIGNSKPFTYRTNNGMTQQTNSTQASRAFVILLAIMGSIDAPGGNLLASSSGFKLGTRASRSAALPREVQELRLGANSFPLWASPDGWPLPSAHIPTVLNAAITGEPYPIKSMMIRGANPVVSYPDTRKVIEALSKLDFLMVLAYTPSPTSEYADLVLPLKHVLEHNHFVVRDDGDYIQTMPKVVDPPEGCLHNTEILYRLSEKMVEKGYIEKNLIPWKNEDEYIEAEFREAGMTFAEACEEGTVSKEHVYRKYTERGFRTPSGKIEIYSSLLEKYGYDPLPTFSEPAETPLTMPKLAADYPLLLVIARHKDYYGTRSADEEWMRDRVPYPELMIHPDAAKERGIKQGDRVTIETLRGCFQHVADVTDDTHRQVVSATFGWWLPESKSRDRGALEVSVNAALSYDPPYDPEVGINSVQNVMCQVHKL